MVFGRNFYEKWQIWASESHFGEVRGDARPWLMARWKAHGRLSIRVNWTFFRYFICYNCGVMRRNVYSSAVFTRVDLFALIFYLDTVVPRQPFLASENKGTGLRDGENSIHLRSLVLTEHWSVTDGQMDGRICCKNCKSATTSIIDCAIYRHFRALARAL